MLVRTYGPRGLLVECGDHRPADVAAAVRAAAPAGVREIVAGAHTVVIECDDADAAAAVRPLVERVGDLSVTAARDGYDEVVVPVRFDGEDLDDVAALVGASATGLVERLTTSELRVAFCGFAPGFAYLDGLPPELHLPRRASPRERIAPGSVAIAAGYAAVYPSASPGGWHLVGHTDLHVWSVERDPPALLQPGTCVRFERAGD